MELDLRLGGAPDSIRATAAWLRSVHAAVQECAETAEEAKQRSFDGWYDNAAEVVRARLSLGGTHTAEFAEDLDLLVKTFEVCSDGLQSAQRHMDKARRIGRDAGLEFNASDEMILKPKLRLIPGLSGGTAVEEETEAHQRRADAYHDAEREVEKANEIIDELREKLGPVSGG